MKIELTFTPPPEEIPPGKFKFLIKLNYEIFPEMIEEFGTDKYLQTQMHVMEVDQVDDNRTDYELELELPYGNYSLALYKTEIDKDGNQIDNESMVPLDEKLLEYFRDYCTPEPISREQQRELDDREEKDNKEKEREARQAQKELEQRKARQKAEAQMQLLKQEQNSAKLKVYFSAMDLYFHKAEEDFNASMSLLSIFHEELHENFQFYEGFFQRFYRKDVNAMIPMQGFFHFAKLMNLASTADELMQFFHTSLKEIDGIYMPIDDTLNVKAGMNYAQFLSALLRIAYIKAD